MFSKRNYITLNKITLKRTKPKQNKKKKRNKKKVTKSIVTQNGKKKTNQHVPCFVLKTSTFCLLTGKKTLEKR